MSQSKSRTRSGRLCSSVLMVSCDVRNNWICESNRCTRGEVPCIGLSVPFCLLSQSTAPGATADTITWLQPRYGYNIRLFIVSEQCWRYIIAIVSHTIKLAWLCCSLLAAFDGFDSRLFIVICNVIKRIHANRNNADFKRANRYTYNDGRFAADVFKSIQFKHDKKLTANSFSTTFLH